jgi:hypothetical protein
MPTGLPSFSGASYRVGYICLDWPANGLDGQTL